MRCPRSCASCRGSAGWLRCSGCRVYCPWLGGSMAGSRGDGAAWCAATRSTTLPRRAGAVGMTRDPGEEAPMTAPAALTAEVVRRTLRHVKDPELDMNIVDLGLVYDVEVDAGEVRVRMTTSCTTSRSTPGKCASA